MRFTLTIALCSVFLLNLNTPSVSTAQSDESISAETGEQTIQADIRKEEPKEITQKKDISEISLEDLLRYETDVAGSRPLNIRENPAVLTVFTQDELKRLGIRDLIDVLRLVPGFEPGLDTFGTVGAGFRGNWAYEGKILFLIDGHSVVERAYTNVPLGNRISMNQIDKIEIIRGPGSAVYGREAELAVVNIITKSGSGFSGITGSYQSSYFLEDGPARQNIDMTAGYNLTNDLYIGASILRGYGKRSDKRYTDIEGNWVDLGRHNRLDPNNLIFNLDYRDLKIGFLYEGYEMSSIDGYNALFPYPAIFQFASYNVSVSNRFKLNQKISLTPQFKFSRQYPWYTKSNYRPTDVYYLDLVADRYTFDIGCNYEPVEDLNLLLGTNYQFDHAEYGDYSWRTFEGGSKKVSYHNAAVYFEASAKTLIANPTAGFRFEHHNLAGNSIVPRFALTKIFGDFHAKFIYNRAFRTPSIEQFHGAANIGIDLKPEKTQIFEAEAGYKFKNSMFLTANFFDITIDDPIAYRWDEATSQDTYTNLEKVGTRGIETEYRYVAKKYFAAFNYSFYIKTKDSTGQFYTDPLNNDRFLGFPNHKLSAYGSIEIFENFHVSPSLILMTGRSAYTSLDSHGDPAASEIGADILVNLYLSYENLFTKGLGLGFGAYDIFNQRPPFIQPYNGSHSPLPGSSPQFIFNVAYSWEKAGKDNKIMPKGEE